MDRFSQALGARGHLTVEPFAYEWMRAANRLVFNRDAIPYHAFEDAEVVLSFGADFIETWLSNVGHARGFGQMHGFRGGKAGTYIHVEPRQSITASSADEWVRNAPGTEGLLALAVLKTLVDEGMVDKRFGEAVAGVDVAKVATDSGVPSETIKHVAQVFGSAKPGLAVGGGVAVAGSNATQTLAAINLLNAAAGNLGKTVRFGPDSAYGKVTPYAEIAALAQAMARGEIEVLLIGPGVNPAFALPGGLRSPRRWPGCRSSSASRTSRTRRRRWPTSCCPTSTGSRAGATIRRARAWSGSCSRRCRRSATRARWVTCS
jgi:molybdopterin-containing oxidoreductase family iron-sulfur binding subunit